MSRALPRPADVPGAVCRELICHVPLPGEPRRPDVLWYVDETGYPILAVELEPDEADALRQAVLEQAEAAPTL